MSNTQPHETFHLQGKEYIELNKLLKLLHLVSTGGEANMCIENGEVIVNGVVEFRKRNKLRHGYEVIFRDSKIIIEE
ncbi:MAG: RNA-binding S4 domain-containing protein [Saprospiraceae bacterium]|nr:RNA-binding S4 domain-containing protein [Candidatus Opimibacter iunctus]